MATTLEIPDWIGYKLTNAAFLGYAEDVVKAYAKNGFDSLTLTDLGPQLQAAVNKLAPFINKPTAYAGTARIQALDKERDALWKALWYAWSHLAQLPPSSTLYASALALKPVMSAYKGIAAHEMVKETKEINGLQRDFETSAIITALKETGLYKIAGTLFEVNTALDAAYDARSEEEGRRDAAKGGTSTPEVRKEVAALLSKCARRVNIANELNPSTATEAAIISVRGIIEQYKKVAAEAKHHDSPAPSPDPSPDTPDPSDNPPAPSGDSSDPSQPTA